MNDRKGITAALPLLAHDRYRWMLLAGWFTLSSAILSFTIAAPVTPMAPDAALILIAMAAFISYSAAMKRYWIALALFVATIAVVAFVLS